MLYKNTNYPLVRLIGGYVNGLGIEGSDIDWINIVKKLEQLGFIEDRIRLLHVKASKSWERKMSGGALSSLEKWKEEDAEHLELETLTESYYHLAHVFRDLLKKLPGLSNLDFLGIRTVRNHLLCHPQRHIPSFGYGGLQGPIIKPEKGAIKYVDEGLFLNIQEMKECIHRAVTRESKSRNLPIQND